MSFANSAIAFLGLLWAFIAPVLFSQQLGVFIHSNYDGAFIFINDAPTDFKTPAQLSNLDTGKIKITLRYPDLSRGTEYAAEKYFTVRPGSFDSIRIDFTPVTVTLVCNAEKTDIYLNGRLKGTGHDLVLDRIIPGTYKLRLKQGYGLAAEKEVYFPPNVSDCPPECFVFGDLTVSSDEWPDADIWINGVHTERKTPSTFSSLLIGEYKIRLVTKHDKFETTFTVKKGEENKITINPTEDRARLAVEERSRLQSQSENEKRQNEQIEQAQRQRKREVDEFKQREKEQHNKEFFSEPIKFGLFGGISTLSMTGQSRKSEWKESSNTGSGFLIGVVAQKPIYYNTMAVRFEFQWFNRGLIWMDKLTNKISVDEIEFINLDFKSMNTFAFNGLTQFSTFNNIKIGFGASFQYNYFRYVKTDSYSLGESSQTISFYSSLTSIALIGYNFTQHFALEFRYYLGMSKILNVRPSYFAITTQIML